MSKRYRVSLPMPKMTPPPDDGLSGVLMSVDIDAEAADLALIDGITAFAQVVSLDSLADRITGRVALEIRLVHLPGT